METIDTFFHKMLLSLILVKMIHTAHRARDHHSCESHFENKDALTSPLLFSRLALTHRLRVELDTLLNALHYSE